jgi:hypothetical protein
MTEEEIEAIAIQEIGRAALVLVGMCDRLGHVTLKGHLMYHHEDVDTIGGAFISWLRWMTAYGKVARHDVHYPDELVQFAHKFCVKELGRKVDV